MVGKNDFSINSRANTDELGEVVSALLDGEAGDVPEQILNEVVQADYTRLSWSRYQLIGEVVREASKEPHLRFASASFAEKVRQQIDAEPTILAPKRRSTRRMPSYLQPVAGIALAASVAAVAVIGVQQMSLNDSENAQPLSVAKFEAAEQVLASDTGAVSSDVADSPELEIDLAEHKRRLNSYLVNFNEQRAGLGMPGVNPYVRIIDFESEK